MVTTRARNRISAGNSKTIEGRTPVAKGSLINRIAKGIARLILVSFWFQVVGLALFVTSSIAGGEGAISWAGTAGFTVIVFTQLPTLFVVLGLSKGRK